MASGGTSGRRGAFVYGREDWIEIIAGRVRVNTAYFDSTRLPRRRIASIAADDPPHMTGRCWNLEP